MPPMDLATVHFTSWRVPLVGQELPTLPENMSLLPVFSGVRVNRSLILCACFVDRCLSFCPFFGHCVVCPASIYGFRLGKIIWGRFFSISYNFPIFFWNLFREWGIWWFSLFSYFAVSRNVHTKFDTYAFNNKMFCFSERRRRKLSLQLWTYINVKLWKYITRKTIQIISWKIACAAIVLKWLIPKLWSFIHYFRIIFN
jgi:hypothetical protein